MKEYVKQVKDTILFEGIEEKDLEVLLQCLSPYEKEYDRGQIIWMTGDRIQEVGLVLTGSVQVAQDDFYGNHNIIVPVGEGEIFGEAYAGLGYTGGEKEGIPFNVVAVQPSHLIFFDYRRILTACPINCSFHTRLIFNLVSILAGKNALLNQKIEHLSKRTTRDKLMAYLSFQAFRKGSDTFDIPFNRQELADYLCVDRSAMSSELTRMKSQGLVDCSKNHFHLKKGNLGQLS